MSDSEMAVAKARDWYVTVCDKCFTASCWHGEFMCWDSKAAGTREMMASELDAIGYEHPSHYSREKLLEVCGVVVEVAGGR